VHFTAPPGVVLQVVVVFPCFVVLEVKELFAFVEFPCTVVVVQFFDVAPPHCPVPFTARALSLKSSVEMARVATVATVRNSFVIPSS
jgi:hypothetical protein